MDSVAGAAMEVDATAPMEITVGSVSIEAIDAGVGAHLEHPGTPRTKSSPSITGSCSTSTDNTNLKPRVGMIFDTLEDVEKFYKFYAHETGFSVRVGQHKKKNEETLFK